MVPHLITSLNGPINELEQRVLESMPAIERWFRLEWMEHTPPFYCSVDLRNAGFKLAPVDTDLFPGALQQPHARDAAAGGAGGDGGDREDLPRSQEPAAHPRAAHAQQLLPGQRAAPGGGVHAGRSERAPGRARPGGQAAAEAGAGRRRRAGARAAGAHARAARPEELRPLHHPAQHRAGAGRAQGAAGPARAVPAAAAACRLDGAAQVAAPAQLRRAGEEVRQAAGHGPVADHADARALRRGRHGRPPWPGLRARPCRDAAGQDQAQVQGIRHQRTPLRRRQARPRRRRHGHPDGARREGPGRTGCRCRRCGAQPVR